MERGHITSLQVSDDLILDDSTLSHSFPVTERPAGIPESRSGLRVVAQSPMIISKVLVSPGGYHRAQLLSSLSLV